MACTLELSAALIHVAEDASIRARLLLLLRL